MVKVVLFFKRKPGMPVEDFQKHWRTTHADIIVRLPGIRRYVQSHVLASARNTAGYGCAHTTD